MKKSQLALVPAATLPYDRLAFFVNQAYIDYYIPVWLDGEQFQQMCLVEDIDLARSVVALQDGDPAGLALLAVRGREGWVCAVGVLPPYRRRGIGRAIIQQMQCIAQQSGLAHLWLEVLTQNAAGEALYRSQGFGWHRDLLVLMAESKQFTPQELPSTAHTMSPHDVFPHYAAFHDVRAPWQRALASLRHQAAQLRGLGLWEAETLIGYALYLPQRNRFAIYDVGVSLEHPHRVAVARDLLRALHSLHPKTGSYIVNFPAEDPLLPALTGLGYRIWQRQCELVWPLAESEPPVMEHSHE